MTSLAAARSTLDAVLFDMDGLLVDTEPQWFAAECEVVESIGGTWSTEHQRAVLGTNLEHASAYIVEVTGTDTPAAEVSRLLCSAMTRQLRKGVEPRPGVLRLLDQVASAGVPAAVVTSSRRVHLDVVLETLPSGVFRATVTADDVARRKPFPDPYLRALDLLGARAHRTVVLEDSPPGVAAAEAAGCRVVAVPSLTPVPVVPGRTVVDSVEDVDLARLVAALA